MKRSYDPTICIPDRYSRHSGGIQEGRRSGQNQSAAFDIRSLPGSSYLITCHPSAGKHGKRS